MPLGWEWDETLFAGSAKYYARGRLPYPENLSKVLGDVLDLDGTGRLLDVGCGPGTVALDVAHLFADVVGVDPDREMIEEAQRAAIARGLGNVRWLRLRAEEISAALGVFQVATMAQSFHWMDRERVAGILFDVLAPNGALVHVDCASTVQPPFDVAANEPGVHPEPPFAAIDTLVQRYLGPLRRAGQGVLLHGTPGGEAEVIEAAGFGPEDRVFVGGGNWHTRSIDDVIAHVFSMSNSAPHLFSDRFDAFERELRALLAESSSSAEFSQRAPYMQLRVWRKR